MRQCTICKRDERSTIFGKDKRCLECNRKRRVEQYNKNIDSEREKSLKRYWLKRDEYLVRMRQYDERIKDEVFQHYGGYICKCCKETEKKFLTIDHINGGGNEHRRSVKGGGSYICRWIKKNNFPPLFQVLCFNCNLGKSKNNNICPHEQKK